MSSREEEELDRFDAELRGTEHLGYETLGRFEPQDAQRIIDRLDEEHIPYEMDAPGEVQPRPTPYLRRGHWVFIYVRPEHKRKAEAIVVEDFRL